MKASYICGNNAHKQSSFYIFSIFILQTRISLAAEKTEMKLKIIINFKQGQMPVKAKNLTFSCVSAFKTMGCVT